jgi:hypothetical protein
VGRTCLRDFLGTDTPANVVGRFTIEKEFRDLAGEDGWGGIGEGMSIQKTRDGRRIMWLAHEGPPKNFTGVDVTDPRHPKVVVQTELPHMKVRSNSLEVCGDIMAVAYQTLEHGLQPAGFELFDAAGCGFQRLFLNDHRLRHHIGGMGGAFDTLGNHGFSFGIARCAGCSVDAVKQAADQLTFFR